MKNKTEKPIINIKLPKYSKNNFITLQISTLIDF